MLVIIDFVRGGTGVSEPKIDITSSVDRLSTKIEQFFIVGISIFASSNIWFYV